MAITIPVIPARLLADAKSVWDQMIDKHGRDVVVSDAGGTNLIPCKAFCKRPKILGLFDRTEQSYDQTRYMVIVKEEDFLTEPPKFGSVTFDSEDHAILSVTQVDLSGTVFGYRILVKG